MKKHMTKEQALHLFKEENPDIIKRYKHDRHAIKLAWDAFTDLLCKNGDISQSQYDKWSNPFEK